VFVVSQLVFMTLDLCGDDNFEISGSKLVGFTVSTKLKFISLILLIHNKQFL
jgi:hypothetical protein